MIKWHNGKNRDEILWNNDRIYLSKKIRFDVIVRHHDDLLIDHFDIEKILKFVQRKYYWINDSFDNQKNLKFLPPKHYWFNQKKRWKFWNEISN